MHLLDLAASALAAEASVADLAAVEVAVADSVGIASEEAVEAEVLVVVAEEEASVVDEGELATSRTATDLQMARLRVLEDHVREASEVDAVATEIVTAIEEATADQEAVTTGAGVVGMTEAPAAPTTNLSAAETDRATEAGMVGMAETMARESVGTKATATTIRDSEGGIRAHTTARVCFCKGLSRLSPFFRLNISRLRG